MFCERCVHAHSKYRIECQEKKYAYTHGFSLDDYDEMDS